MSMEWLGFRIAEEQERRQREAAVLARLPRAFEDLFDALKICIDAYNDAFGKGTAAITIKGSRIQVEVLPENSEPHPPAFVRIDAITSLPGFRIDAVGDIVDVEVGLLPEGRVFYKLQDQYLTVEQLTRRALDRALFPRLKE